MAELEQATKDIQWIKDRLTEIQTMQANVTDPLLDVTVKLCAMSIRLNEQLLDIGELALSHSKTSDTLLQKMTETGVVVQIGLDRLKGPIC